MPPDPPRPQGTRPRRLLMNALRQAGAFRSADTLHHTLRAEGHRIGLTTIYRHLNDLAANGAVDQVRDETGKHLFRLRHQPGHAHYLVCRHCGAGVEIGEPSLERWLTQVGLTHGYRGLRHDLTVSGACPACDPGDGDAGPTKTSGRRSGPQDPAS